jgi:hypothetical protein
VRRTAERAQVATIGPRAADGASAANMRWRLDEAGKEVATQVLEVPMEQPSSEVRGVRNRDYARRAPGLSMAPRGPFPFDAGPPTHRPRKVVGLSDLRSTCRQNVAKHGRGDE